jgi:GGDEF domain-containing protein
MTEDQGLPVDGRPADRLTRAARAARELCDVLWEALSEELRHADAERVRQISERLSSVSGTIGVLAHAAPRDPVERPTPADRPTPAERSTAPESPASGEPSTSGERRTPPEPVRPQPGGDERRFPEESSGPELRLAPHPPALLRPEPPSPFQPQPSAPFQPQPPAPQPQPPAALKPIDTRVADYTFTRLVDEHESAPPGESLAPAEPAAAEIEVRDVRREEGPSAWITSVGRLLERHAREGLPFAVLLIEIVDVARLERSETPHDLHGIVRLLESALGRGMRATDELSRETLGRYWLAAPDTDTAGARMLAERLAHLVRTTAIHRGVPLEVAIGIAICPHDGADAPALAARADLGVYSARANGRSVAHMDLPPG